MAPSLLSPATTAKVPNLTVEENLATLANRTCKLAAHNSIKVPRFHIASEFVAYASPDSTYAVTKRFFDLAEKSILIGIYDFSADHIKQLVLKAMERGVKVSLMLDVDSQKEADLFAELAKFGCECVLAPSCASPFAHHFASSHEKVIVIDGLWTLVQSGNYSDRSCPFNDEDGKVGQRFVPGNRDMGLAVKSKPLAQFFSKVLRSDMTLELKGEKQTAALGETRTTYLAESVLLAAPSNVPDLYPSKTFTFPKQISVQPVLTPDNYMDIIPELLVKARKSILIEQQYIRTSHEAIITLLEAIRDARTAAPALDIRIILARPIGKKEDVAKGYDEMDALKNYGLKWGVNVRILNSKYFTHCHNKLILVDGKSVLISSQNWSRTAVMTNREAGLLVESKELAKYYARFFEWDWQSGIRSRSNATPAKLAAAAGLNSGRAQVRLDLGDIALV